MDFNPTAANGNPGGLLVSNNKLFFLGTDGTHGIELWQTDGTNVTRLTDLSYGSVNSFIGTPVEYNGEIYFRGSGTTNGTINLEHTPGGGLMVTIALPAAKARTHRS